LFKQAVINYIIAHNLVDSAIDFNKAIKDFCDAFNYLWTFQEYLPYDKVNEALKYMVFNQDYILYNGKIPEEIISSEDLKHVNSILHKKLDYNKYLLNVFQNKTYEMTQKILNQTE
jgi:hypothetical protein